VLSLTAYLTRAYWLPALGIDTVIAPTVSPTGAVVTPIATSTPSNESLTEFVDPQGDFTLSYPANWPTQDVGNQAQQWILPGGVVMSVHAEPALPGDTLEGYAQEVITRLPYDVLEQVEIQLGGQPAVRQEIAFPGMTQRIAVGYLVLYKDKKYQIALSGLDRIAASDQDRVIQEFEALMTTFKFQP